MKSVCEFVECSNPVRALGYCPGHYRQHHAGKPLTPLRKYNRVQDDGDNRQCTECKQWKNREDEFYIRNTGIRQSKCRSCMIKDHREDTLIRTGRM